MRIFLSNLYCRGVNDMYSSPEAMPLPCPHVMVVKVATRPHEAVPALCECASLNPRARV